MQAINTNKNQTIADIAVLKYGNVDAIPELLALNPGMATANEDESLLIGEIDLGFPIVNNSTIVYDESSSLVNRKVVQELAGQGIASYAPVYTRLHRQTQLFVDRLTALSTSITMQQTLILDRFVRDMMGERNIDYPTAFVRQAVYAIYPIIGGTPTKHQLNLFDAGVATTLSFPAGFHTANGVAIAAPNYLDTQVPGSLDVSNFSCGCYFENSFTSGIALVRCDGVNEETWVNGTLIDSQPVSNIATAMVTLNTAIADASVTYKTIFINGWLDDSTRVALEKCVTEFNKRLNRL